MHCHHARGDGLTASDGIAVGHAPAGEWAWPGLVVAHRYRAGLPPIPGMVATVTAGAGEA